jgi:hypothetical protein
MAAPAKVWPPVGHSGATPTAASGAASTRALPPPLPNVSTSTPTPTVPPAIPPYHAHAHAHGHGTSPPPLPPAAGSMSPPQSVARLPVTASTAASPVPVSTPILRQVSVGSGTPPLHAAAPRPPQIAVIQRSATIATTSPSLGTGPSSTPPPLPTTSGTSSTPAPPSIIAPAPGTPGSSTPPQIGLSPIMPPRALVNLPRATSPESPAKTTRTLPATNPPMIATHSANAPSLSHGPTTQAPPPPTVPTNTSVPSSGGANHGNTLAAPGQHVGLSYSTAAKRSPPSSPGLHRVVQHKTAPAGLLAAAVLGAQGGSAAYGHSVNTPPSPSTPAAATLSLQTSFGTPAQSPSSAGNYTSPRDGPSSGYSTPSASSTIGAFGSPSLISPYNASHPTTPAGGATGLSSSGTITPVPPVVSLTNTRMVDYIFIAEFDIDKGSVLRYEYPRDTGVKKNIIAEAMLPEGVHLREADWTTFFLPVHDENGAVPPTPSQPAITISATGTIKKNPLHHDDDKHDGEPREFYTCLNLVKTKMDKTVRRGAIVKALAICTRHRFVHIYKVIHIQSLLI